MEIKRPTNHREWQKQIEQAAAFVGPVLKLQALIRDAVVSACEQNAVMDLTTIVREEEGDTIYSIDRVSEDLIISFLEQEIDLTVPLILIAEGLPGGQLVLPRGSAAEDAAWRIIVDPIDGTRGLMYQKRSAWILTGIAPNYGPNSNLQDILVALQTEIPLVKQHLSDVVWAVRGNGVQAERYNRLSGRSEPLQLRPSTATSIAHGFAMISRFFPGAREELAAIDEEIIMGALGPVQPGKAHCFEDQYVCSGGQLYELMAGHDRFVADLRPLLETMLARRGLALGICCHPYDVCTELIARELGVIVTDVYGNPLRAPLNVEANVDWIGYANNAIQAQIEPLLQSALSRRGLL
jgi:fructose-1,6-bisphosphatase/inositol monophosphatase family enzyme